MINRFIFIAALIATLFLVTCESLPGLLTAEPGASMTHGDFLVEVTDGENGRGITLLRWLPDRKKAAIPAKIEKVPVTAIGERAFADKTLLKEITIPPGVWKISANAFENSSAIQKVTAHKKNPRFLSVSGILYDRESLDKVYYPVAKHDFDYRLLRQDDAGESVYALSVSGYKGAETVVSVPDDVQGYPVTGIADRAFAGLDFIKRVKLPRHLDTVGEDVFEKCLRLETFALSSQNINYTVNERDLYDTRTGKLVWYPEAQGYFQYETVSMEGISYIVITGAGNTKKKAAIPPKLNGIRVNEIASGTFENNPALTEIILSDSIFKMGVRAFAFSPKLAHVTLGNNLAVIPPRAFYECTALQEIVIPDSVTTISLNAFSDCTALKTVTLGRRLASLENSAFSGCSALTEIAIPERVSTIGENAFAGCRNLQNIRVDEKNKDYADIDGVLFNKAQTAILRFPEGRPRKQYTIPDSVDKIGSAAFSFCQRLSTIDFPEKLTVIGNYAFFYCTALYNIRLGENIVAIGNDAFSGCTNLGEINFPDSLLSIGDRAFASCRALQAAALPRNVVSIGENAFRDCDRLTQVTLSRKTNVSSTAFMNAAEISYTD
ncbi:MAG: leucine-rich repeat domain-containing protein [Spirochaetaceae bacterium]|jgi:hypothetical protein|nr:leucine-rich repeat domain-containing protein [Spirochaetaceae bacterium]